MVETVEMQPTNALREGLKSASSPLLNTSMSMVVREDLGEEELVSDEDSFDENEEAQSPTNNPPIVDKQTVDCFAHLFVSLYWLFIAIVMWPVKHKSFFMEHSYLLIPVCIMVSFLFTF